MPSTTKENETLLAPPESAGLPSEATTKAQPVALEVAVTVNGARTVDGSDKREPFSENTKTVLVFGTGAVIRLSSSVAPGQLLFLTNDKTKKEVVCQVVKSKNYRSVSGYVELEFTEPVVGFWGMRFPSDRIGVPQPVVPSTGVATGNPAAKPSDSSAAKPVAPLTPASILPDLNSNSAPVKSNTPIPSAFDSPRAPESKASIFAPPPQAPAAPPAVDVISMNSESDFSANASRKDGNSGASANWPSVSEMKTVPPSHPPVASDPVMEALKQRTARLQEQLSSFAFSDAKTAKPAEKAPASASALNSVPAISDAALKVVEIAHFMPDAPLSKPAQAPKSAVPPVKSSLDEEELKIPAWLEPLSRNASVPSSTQELIEREKAKRVAEQQPKVEEFVSDSFGSPEEENTKQLPPPFLISQPTQAEVRAAEQSRTKSSGNGLTIAAVAAGALLIAGAGWWFLRTHSGAPINSAASRGPVAAAAVSTPVESQQPQSQPNAPLQSRSAAPAEPVTQAAPAQNSAVAAPQASSAVAAVRNASERNATNPAKNTNAGAKPVPVQPAAEEPEPKKPVLGEVRFAAPTVTRRETPQDAGAADPGAALAEDQPVSNSAALGSGLGVSAKQPAAPTAPAPAGGDVKPAKLISSVPPIYPALAKNQHVSGNVLIDALIDSTGHVTTMKVVSGPTLLQQAAMDALRQWKYQPALLDGKPAPMHLTVTIQFRLQ